MNDARTELYVYYRVAAADQPAALQMVHEFQRRLRTEHRGLAARVLRRSAEGREAVTLMEVYTYDNGTRAGVDATLRAVIEAAATSLAPLLASPRRTESFDALD